MSNMSGCWSEKVQARDFTRYSWKAEVVAGLPFVPWKIPCKCSSLTLPVPQWKCGTHVPFCLSKSPLWSVSLKKTERLPLLQDKPSGSWCCFCKYCYGWIWVCWGPAMYITLGFRGRTSDLCSRKPKAFRTNKTSDKYSKAHVFTEPRHVKDAE